MRPTEPTTDESTRRLTWRIALIVLAVALAARAGWGWIRLARASSNPASVTLEFPDEDQYWRMARSLAEGHGLRDEMGFCAGRMPLYPAFLSLFAGRERGIAQAKAVQWVLGSLSACFAAGMATTLLGRRAGLLTGLLVALDPFLVFFSSLLLTETLFITALCGLWWMLATMRRSLDAGHHLRWIGIGLTAATCVYLRESSIGLVAVALLLVALMRRDRFRGIAGAALAAGLVVASLVPWGYRNQLTTGRWCWLTLRGGISLYDGVGPRATGSSDLGDIKQSSAVQGLSEAEWDRHFREQSIAAIKADPGRILRLAGTKLLRMWNPIPNVEAYRSGPVRRVAMLWTIPTFALGIAGVGIWILRDRRRSLFPVALLLLPAVYFSILHSVFVGSVRYRLPAMPMITVFVAAAIVSTRRMEPVSSSNDRDGDRTM